MMSVNGKKAAPVSAAENPATWMSANGGKENAPPS
jgi:hypothetical protein